MSASFCSPEKDIELALWRCYGDNGHGVSIATSTDYLCKISNETTNMRFEKIKYLSTEAMNMKAKQFWTSNMNVFESEFKSSSKLSEPAKKLLLSYYEDGYFYKHESNSFENEYRLLYKYTDLSSFCIPGLNGYVDNHIDYITLGDDIKACYSISIKDKIDENTFIDRITIGPLCKATENEIKMLLSKYQVPYCGVTKEN